jgi:hypothetical protein
VRATTRLEGMVMPEDTKLDSSPFLRCRLDTSKNNPLMELRPSALARSRSNRQHRCQLLQIRDHFRPYVHQGEKLAVVRSQCSETQKQSFANFFAAKIPISPDCLRKAMHQICPRPGTSGLSTESRSYFQTNRV